MRRLNYDLLALLGITLLLGVLLGAYITNELKICDSVVYSKVEYRDSIVVKDTMVITLISGKPTKVKTKPANNAQISNFDSAYIDTNLFTVNKCIDTNYYETLTHYPDSFRARMSATVTANELIDVAVEFQNLKPDVIKIVERTNTIEKKQSLVKVYAGLYGGVALKGQTLANYRGGVAFDAIISDKHLIGLNGGINNNLQPEIGIRFSQKIRFK
jgi:hypothetical protein